jgi:alkanesulfonate monooxygenase SsuD/methylene tetrahydromethanopterin reductase-like flavin-dependent oxidoreductase (luciferase family)
VGYLEPEFRALGIPFADKGARTDDYLAAMRAIWTEARPEHDGRFARFASVQAQPQPGAVPIVVGGHPAGAYRRAVESANGWYGFALDPDGTDRALAGLREAGARYERPPALGPLEISLTPRGPVDAVTAARFATLGVDRLIMQPHYSLDEAGVARYVTTIGETLIGRV